MKKCFVFNCLGLMFAMGLTTSCSSTDEDVFSVETGLVQKGITTDLNGGYFDVDVKSNGSWTASVPDDCDWITVIDEAGSGNSTVKICIDGNYTNDYRNTKLILTGGGDVFEIPINQNTDIDGAPAENSGDETFANLAYTKGLGFGYRLEEYNSDGTLNEKKSFRAIQPVINLVALDTLKNIGNLSYKNLSTYQTINVNSDEACNVDSVEVKHDSLGVRMTFDIAYGLFKLKISGQYIGAENRTTNDKTYHTSRNYPSFKGGLDYASIAGLYSNYVGSKTVRSSDEEKDIISTIYTTGFRKKIENITDVIGNSNDENYTENSKLVKAVASLVGTYGPVVTTGTTLGGKCSLEFCCDSTVTQETMGIDSAQVAVDITSGLFSLNADVQASYIKSATDLLQSGYFKSDIKGGSLDARADLGKALPSCKADSINEAVVNWAKTIVAADNTDENTSEVLDVDYVGIWEFVPDATIAAIVEAYVRKKYPDLNIYDW